ncbi:MAG: DegT/DnrJ/EryC1/StrS family aminotransferase [Smithellaceae bacterium]|nr:DegT/DnrJ/EryC1/StrS family aminotransferase [Smithellaceae bacterium]
MPARKKFIVFGSPLICEEEITEVVDSLRSGWLGTGPKVTRFEETFAAYKGLDATKVAAVNSCTAALHLSMIAAGIGPGDEVITTALTFCATVNAIIHTGATPVLCDINPHTFNIDPDQIEGMITKKTKAIVPVHFAGRCCEMDEISILAKKHGLTIIEDCAHAIESEYRGRKAGTFGKFGCFSFYVTKNVVTGEGGMVIARGAKDTARIRVLALHGMSRDAWRRYSDSGYKHYQVVECGYKYNMMDLQAAIGIHQLKRVEANWKRREEIWRRYQDAFADLPVIRPAEAAAGTRHAYHLYALLIDRRKAGLSRDAFLDEMTARDIGVGVHYLCLAEHPFYRRTYHWRPQDYPEATRVGRQTVSIPLSAKLSDKDVSTVITAVRNTLRSARK